MSLQDLGQVRIRRKRNRVWYRGEADRYQRSFGDAVATDDANQRTKKPPVQQRSTHVEKRKHSGLSPQIRKISNPNCKLPKGVSGARTTTINDQERSSSIGEMKTCGIISSHALLQTLLPTGSVCLTFIKPEQRLFGWSISPTRKLQAHIHVTGQRIVQISYGNTCGKIEFGVGKDTSGLFD